MEVEIYRMERGIQIFYSTEDITIGISLSSQHVGKMVVEYDVLEQTVTSMLIYLYSLMTIITRNRNITHCYISAVKDIYRIGEINNLQIIDLGMRDPFHVYCVPAIVHLLRLCYAIIHRETMMSEHSIPLAAQSQITNCNILQHGNVEYCRLVTHIARP